MCGFVGFVDPVRYPTLSRALGRASDTMAHRGPDDSGTWFFPQSGVGLAHRRLSILDLSEHGKQPMATDGEEAVVVYNGEVYNFAELRDELTGLGHEFHTGTDTEVILKAYLQWGERCLDRFVGMFALAIWDSRHRRLFLARDRVGIKPLYYRVFGHGIWFASELKALMALPGFETEIDHQAVPGFLHYQYVPAPGTIFQNTYKLRPGRCAVYENGQLTLRTWYSLPDMSESTGPTDEKEAVDRLEELALRAVNDRLVADVPLGALLSGGIDSSAVVALMQQNATGRTKTYSIGFESEGYDEAPWAKKVADHLGTDHTELYVTPKEALDVVPKLPEMYDEPFADSSGIPTFLVSRLARDGVTVALSGDGGDEQFAGYVRYWSTAAMHRALAHVPGSAARAAGFLLKGVPVPWVETVYRPIRDHLPQRFQVGNFKDKWAKLISLLGEKDLKHLYHLTVCIWTHEEARALTGEDVPHGVFEEAFEHTEDWPVVSRLMRADQRTYLPDCMLTKVDRASMAVSLEVRVPLLDHRLLEYAATLPEGMKFRNGVGKYVLRELLARYVPRELFERPKMGFGVPVAQWLRTDLRELLCDYLSDQRLRDEGLFDHYMVEKILSEHLSGAADHHYKLWSLLMWEMWRDKWLGRQWSISRD
ncbi:MAG: asparagine synthase (glutamine-hydrolyzing) [Desulfatibacillaceae bacterium]